MSTNEHHVSSAAHCTGWRQSVYLTFAARKAGHGNDRVWKGMKPASCLSILCHFHGLLFAQQMLDKPIAATQCNVPHSTRDAHWYSSFVNQCIGDYASLETASRG